MEANRLRCSNDDLRIFHSDLNTPHRYSSLTSLTFDSILIATSDTLIIVDGIIHTNIEFRIILQVLLVV